MFAFILVFLSAMERFLSKAGKIKNKFVYRNVCRVIFAISLYKFAFLSYSLKCNY